MIIHEGIFSAALWLAVAIVACGAVFLLVMLVREWRQGRLW